MIHAYLSIHNVSCKDGVRLKPAYHLKLSNATLNNLELLANPVRFSFPDVKKIDVRDKSRLLREGDNETTVADSCRFGTLRNKIYTGGARGICSITLASCAMNSSRPRASKVN